MAINAPIINPTVWPQLQEAQRLQNAKSQMGVVGSRLQNLLSQGDFAGMKDYLSRVSSHSEPLQPETQEFIQPFIDRVRQWESAPNIPNLLGKLLPATPGSPATTQAIPMSPDRAERGGFQQPTPLSTTENPALGVSPATGQPLGVPRAAPTDVSGETAATAGITPATPGKPESFTPYDPVTALKNVLTYAAQNPGALPVKPEQIIPFLDTMQRTLAQRFVNIKSATGEIYGFDTHNGVIKDTGIKGAPEVTEGGLQLLEAAGDPFAKTALDNAQARKLEQLRTEKFQVLPPNLEQGFQGGYFDPSTKTFVPFDLGQGNGNLPPIPTGEVALEGWISRTKAMIAQETDPQRQRQLQRQLQVLQDARSGRLDYSGKVAAAGAAAGAAARAGVEFGVNPLGDEAKNYYNPSDLTNPPSTMSRDTATKAGYVPLQDTRVAAAREIDNAVPVVQRLIGNLQRYHGPTAGPSLSIVAAGSSPDAPIAQSILRDMITLGSAARGSLNRLTQTEWQTLRQAFGPSGQWIPPSQKASVMVLQNQLADWRRARINVVGHPGLLGTTADPWAAFK